MSFGAFFFVKYAKKYNFGVKDSSSAKVEILSSLHLTGRDKFFAVRCGPDVIAFVLTQSGACLLGRWSYEHWNENKIEKQD